MQAPLPINEPQRLAALRRLRILDTLPERAYDDLTRIAAQICGTPISLVSLIDEDRQWFKSNLGLAAIETPRSLAFCAHNILEPTQPLVVEDARTDARFRDNTLIDNPGVIFYAGTPLLDRDGFALGSLCVIDHRPRQLTADQLAALRALGRQVEVLLDHRRQLDELAYENERRRYAYRRLEEFSTMLAHDLKAPLRNVRQLAEVLLEDYADQLDEGARPLMDMLWERAGAASTLIDGILRYGRATYDPQRERESIELPELVAELAVQEAGTAAAAAAAVEFSGPLRQVELPATPIRQVLQNLIGNALKYGAGADAAAAPVTVRAERRGSDYYLSVTDQGPGIPPEQQQSIFSLFHRLPQEPGAAAGHGVGLSIVRRLVNNLGGTVGVDSELGRGSTFYCSIPVEEPRLTHPRPQGSR